MTASSFEFRSLELQRFQTLLKLLPIELHATFVEDRPWRTHGASASSTHSTATTITSSEPPRKKYRPSRALQRLAHVFSERNIAPARSKWAKYSTFQRAGAKNISRHPTAPHPGAVFLHPSPPLAPQARQNSPCSPHQRPAGQKLAQHVKTPQNRRYFRQLGEFCPGLTQNPHLLGEFYLAHEHPRVTLAGRYAHSPNLAWRAHTPQRRWHTGHMTDAPTPRTRTNEPAQASSLPSLAITGASGNVGGAAARLLAGARPAPATPREHTVARARATRVLSR